MVGAWAPWIGVAIAATSITHFLLGVGKWEIAVPWQVRAYTRVLVLIVFVYLMLIGVTIMSPDQSAKMPIFNDAVALVGDLMKTMIGAVIAALSMSLKRDDEVTNLPPSQEKPQVEE